MKTRRLARHLFTFCAAASLLLCVALAVLWARTYNVAYGLQRTDIDPATGDHRDLSVSLATGRALVYLTRTPRPSNDDFDDVAWPDGQWRMSRDSYWYATRNDMGVRLFNVRSFPQPGMTSYGRPGSFGAGVNLLIPIALTAALPIAWRVRHLLARRRRRLSRQFPHGRCVHCGYDLRGTPERCPECGTTVPAPTIQS